MNILYSLIACKHRFGVGGGPQFLCKAAAVTLLSSCTQHPTSSILLIGSTPLLLYHNRAGTSTSSYFTLFRCSSVNGGVASRAVQYMAAAAACTPTYVHVYGYIGDNAEFNATPSPSLAIFNILYSLSRSSRGRFITAVDVYDNNI